MPHWKSATLIALLALLLFCGGTAGEQKALKGALEGLPAEVAAIAAAGDELLAAYLARDLDRWLAGFTDDVVVLPPGAGMVVGKEALREASRVQFARLAGYTLEIESDVLETVVAGDWAYTRDSYEVRFEHFHRGDVFRDRGRSLTIWERQADGSWLVARHMVNRPTHGPE